MSRPDFLLLGMLVHQDVLTFDQAKALSELYAARGYDNPVPQDLDAGLDIAIDAMAEGEDDAEINRILARVERDGEVSSCACGERCSGCGGPVEDDMDLDDEDLEGALTLWFGLNPSLRDALLAQI